MKLPTVFAAALFAASAGAYVGAYAADADKAPPADSQAAQPAQAAKPAKPHSHVEEKTGVPQKAPAPERKLKADKDKSKHYHPRDMK